MGLRPLATLLASQPFGRFMVTDIDGVGRQVLALGMWYFQMLEKLR